jgi:hypothetical protein
VHLLIFAPWSQDITILTCVLVGVIVVWALQETLGWNFSGLVVPGYLSSVFLVDPQAGAFIVAEVALTTLIVQSLADRIPLWFPWSPLFGRDRFLVFLLVAAGVRIALEAGGAAFALSLGGAPLGEGMHTIGLVIVPLAANSLWRLGWAYGVGRLAIQAALTWAALRFVAIPLTNLSLEGFLLAFEDLERSFVSSSRATLILLVGAWFGSRANARWGWDFGGIIVPGLLALCWLDPARLVATLVESAVLFGMMSLLLRTPLAARLNLTGDRPIVLLFVFAYALRWALGWILPEWADYGGFGYMLTAILAGAAVRRADLVRTLTSVVVVSGTAFAAAMGLSFGLYLLTVAPDPAVEREPEVLVQALTAERDLAVAIEQRAAAFPRSDREVSWEDAPAVGREARAAALRDRVFAPAVRWSRGDEIDLAPAEAAAWATGGLLEVRADEVVYAERSARIVFRRGRPARVVRVPFAVEEPWAVEASQELRDAAWISIVTSPPRHRPAAYDPATPGHVAVALAAASGEVDLIDVRSLNAGVDPGLDAIVSTGGAGRGAVPAWLGAWLDAGGQSWAPYAGRAEELPLADAANTARMVARGRHATVWLREVAP